MSWFSKKFRYEVEPPRLLFDVDKAAFTVLEFEDQVHKRTFTVITSKSQAVRGPVIVGHWCKMKKNDLPADGGTVEADLNDFRRAKGEDKANMMR